MAAYDHISAVLLCSVPGLFCRGALQIEIFIVCEGSHV